MSNYDKFDLDIIQTSPTGEGIGPDSIVSALIACSTPCFITEGVSCQFTYDCSRPDQTCGTGCQVTTSITIR